MISDSYIDFGFEEDIAPASPEKIAYWVLSQPPAGFPMPNPLLSPCSSSPVIHQHVRNLSGIIDTLFAPPKPDDTPLPSLGALAMLYLRAHGYDTSSVLHVCACYRESLSADHFASKLSLRGLPMAEGRYLWETIHNGHPNLTF